MDIDGVRILGRGLTAKGPEGIVFEDVDLRVDASTLAVVTGPGGTGRTTLLMALCGRMRLIAGTLDVDGHVLPSGARAVRQLVRPARLTPGFELEGNHRVDQALSERRGIGRVSPPDIDWACEVVGLELHRRTLLRDLPAVERTLLAIALTAASQPAGLVIDDVESGLPIGQRARVWGALHTLTRTGMTVVASSTDPPGTPVEVIRLPPFGILQGPGAARHRAAGEHGDRGGSDTDVLPAVEDR